MITSLSGKRFPHIGMRIIKSAFAVFSCFLFYRFFRKSGIMFYSQLAALWCIQPQTDNMLNKAVQRTTGTAIGAVYGLIALLIDKSFITHFVHSELCYALFVSFCIILVIYTTLIIHKKDASYFSCVVFLSIVVIHIGDSDPFIFVFNRFADTMIGIFIGMVINSFHIPRRKEKDILFISGIDDTLMSHGQSLSSYSLVQLNRMLSQGVNFTVSTRHTPAAIIELLHGVNLKLPVITMDGAAIYDTNTHEYLHAYVISRKTSQNLKTFLDGFGVNYFINMIIDNMLVIQYKELINTAEQKLYKSLHTSPFRNYTTTDLLSESRCIYFMLINKTEIIEKIYTALQNTGFSHLLRIVSYESKDYQGYSYIKIYNKNANRENMIEYLKNITGLKRTVTFGSIEGKYDVYITEYSHDKVVRTLKKLYEPPVWKK